MDEAYYEKEIKKNMNHIESLQSKAELTEDKELPTIVDQMGQIISNTEKTIKDYNIYNVMNNNDQTKGNTIQRKLTDSKKKWKKLKEKIKLLKKNNKSNSINDDEIIDNSHNIRMNSFNKLQQATRATIETESMSGNILGDLNNQTSQMKGVSSKLGLMNNDIDSSNGILDKMFSRQNRDKRMIIIFAFILILTFVGTLTYKIMKKNK